MRAPDPRRRLRQRAGGLPGAILASACFTLPSALLMLAFAHGLAQLDLARAGGLHGLKLAAVAVVAQAVWTMGRRLCPDRPRVALAIGGAAALLLAFPGSLAQLGVIALGGLFGGLILQDGAAPTEEVAGRHPGAIAALLSFGALFFALPARAEASGARELAVADAFYRAGALVFGGGHVVLPLLRAEVVPRGWVEDSAFLAGYGAAQALPGPLFAFAAYLGAAMSGPGRALRGLLAMLALFLPGWLLVGGALPFWRRLRARPGAQAALAGANAAVVGLLLAALYDPVFTEAVAGPTDLASVLVAFGLLEHGRAPPWLLVLGLALAAQAGLGA